MSGAKHSTSPALYASSDDFRRAFHKETDSLYRPAFLLTADAETAQQCLVSELEDSINGNPVFKDWAHSWARRTIIQNAFRAINPRPMEQHADSSFDGGGATLAVEGVENGAVLQNRSSALSISCRFLNATPSWIVLCFWAAPGGT
jgi:hypothetical protein